MRREPMIVHCGDCSHEWAPCFLPAPVDVAAKAMKQPCPLCGSKTVYPGSVPRRTADGDAVGWLTDGDTGISSLTIWHVLMGRVPHKNFWADAPHDPADFGRCYRLLKVMPSWRGRLGEVADKYPIWRGFVNAWDELAALYEEEEPKGVAPKLYARIQTLRGDA